MLKLNRYDHAAFWSFFCYSGCSFAIPVVMVELAAALGFPLKDGGMSAGGMLHVVRSATMLTAMLICGFIAGRFGKRRTMGAAVVLMGCGIIAAALTRSYNCKIYSFPCLKKFFFGLSYRPRGRGFPFLFFFLRCANVPAQHNVGGKVFCRGDQGYATGNGHYSLDMAERSLP